MSDSYDSSFEELDTFICKLNQTQTIAVVYDAQFSDYVKVRNFMEEIGIKNPSYCKLTIDNSGHLITPPLVIIPRESEVIYLPDVTAIETSLKDEKTFDEMDYPD